MKLPKSHSVSSELTIRTNHSRLCVTSIEQKIDWIKPYSLDRQLIDQQIKRSYDYQLQLHHFSNKILILVAQVNGQQLNHKIIIGE